MKLAVYSPADLPNSSRIYMENVTLELKNMGHTVIPFSGKELPERADIYWQPSGGRNGPDVIFKQANAPFVITFHGAANLALPLSLCFGARFKSRWNGWKSRLKTLREWRSRSSFYDTVITVSEYAKKEAEEYLRIPGYLITPIYHGVNYEIFYPLDEESNTEKYFLHISSYQPKKNLERIIAAYRQIGGKPKPRLKVIAPGYHLVHQHEGIEFIDKHLDHQLIAAFYQNALGFIFPSLHETFGMPILEAMACGCPVITSHHPGCAEIAGDAALMVNPYVVEEIAEAMKQLIVNTDLRKKLRHRGIERAKCFTWQKSAEEHLAVFRKVRV